MAFSRNAPAPRSVEDFITEPHRRGSKGDSRKPRDIEPEKGLKAAKQKVNSCSPYNYGHMTKTSRGRQATAGAPTWPGDPNRTPHRRPWSASDRKATAKNLFNLRLNGYYLDMLRYLASLDEDTSMQLLVKEILLPELERRALEINS